MRRPADSSNAPISVKQFQCPKCPRTFTALAGLRLHEVHHSTDVQPKTFFQEQPPTAPYEPVGTAFDVSGDGDISVSFTFEGLSLAEAIAEDAAAAELAAEQHKARLVENVRRQRLREAEEEGDRGEHRRGSGTRHQYTAKEIVEMIEIVNRIHEDSTITNKGKAWAEMGRNPKYYGVAFSNTSKWRKPEEHRRQLKAAAREHAGSLLRVDRTSRKQGKYVAMEKELFSIFKSRRARGRKASARWLTHTARHLLLQQDPVAAAGFKGGNSWRRRFRARWGISIRKKTNVKNTTWEETKPILQRYFRTLRRRVTLSAYSVRRSSQTTPSPLPPPLPQPPSPLLRPCQSSQPSGASMAATCRGSVATWTRCRSVRQRYGHDVRDDRCEARCDQPAGAGALEAAGHGSGGCPP